MNFVFINAKLVLTLYIYFFKSNLYEYYVKE